ncbi:MAG: hypothetical protein AB7P07_10710 [Hyphomonadaceae bacterium]
MLKFLAASFVMSAALIASAAAETQWRVRSSEGLDALLLIGAAAGDVMQQEEYPEEIAWVRANMSAEGLAAMAVLDQTLRVEIGALTGPTMAHFFSAGQTDTIAQVIASAEDPERLLRPGLEALPDWSEENYQRALPLLPQAAIALRALDAAGFSQWRSENEGAAIAQGIETIRAAVEGHDVIGENQRFLARQLEPAIEIVVLAYCRPYGIRIKGQRFVTHYSWDAGTQLRTAAHEIFHAPFDDEDWRLWARLERLQSDPWMNSIVVNHDPRFGYNSFDGVVDEGSTQALDQVVAERLGIARDPRDRWRRSDGGMHMLAAALYHAMKEDGYDRRGGDYGQWLVSALDRGLLTPVEVRRRATIVVDRETVDQWDRPAESESAAR